MSEAVATGPDAPGAPPAPEGPEDGVPMTIGGGPGRVDASEPRPVRQPDDPPVPNVAAASPLPEEAAYLRALGRNDTAGYRAFLEHFPESVHGSEVTARIRAVERRQGHAARDEVRHPKGEGR